MRHKIAGISFHEKELKEIARENPDYELSKSELLDFYSDGDKIWKYDFEYITIADLRPEPDNEYDKNAIAVYSPSDFGPVKIGYVKKGSTKQIDLDRAYLLELGGGPYKEICEDEDGKITIERGETSFWGCFYLPEEASSHGSAPAKAEPSAKTDETSIKTPPASAPAPVKTEKKKSKVVMLLLWFFLGLFGGHKFYEGKTGMGFVYMFTVGLFVVGWICDLFKILKYPSRF